jgi:hypothetical protein
LTECSPASISWILCALQTAEAKMANTTVFAGNDAAPLAR